MFPGKTRTKSKPCSIGTSFPGNENGILWNFDVPGYLILLSMFSKISTYNAKAIFSLCAVEQSINRPDLVLYHLIYWIQCVCLSLFALTVLMLSLLFKNIMFYFEIGAHMVQANLESTMTLNLGFSASISRVLPLHLIYGLRRNTPRVLCTLKHTLYQPRCLSIPCMYSYNITDNFFQCEHSAVVFYGQRYHTGSCV